MRRTIARHRMLAPGERVLVAFSGGADSVALLAALHQLAERLGIQLCAAHLNHRLRGVEALRDQQCAQAIAAQLGVRCVVGETESLAGRSNIEERARTARYAFLQRVADAEGCAKIATGHTMDDQAETLLMRLLRGTGPGGLSGIQAVRDGRIIRPMIECSRAQALAFLEHQGLPFCEDSSNADTHFLRNRIRHQILPQLRALNPSVVERLASAATMAAVEDDLLDEQAATVLAQAMAEADALRTEVIAGAPAAMRTRLVRRWLRQQRGDLRRITAAHLWAVVDLATGQRPSGSVLLPGGQEIVRDYGRLRWRGERRAASEESAQVLEPGSAVSLRSGWRIRAEIVAVEQARRADLWEVVADADAVGGPLIVRTVRHGDRVCPLGMHGHRKLQDVFVDRKWPREERWSTPVIEVAGEILWVPGVVRSGRALIGPSTRAALRLAAQRTGIAGP
jgi:tRNA(Ile)-lysidine synthase